MTDNFTGPELFEQSAAALRDVIDPPSDDQDTDQLLKIAQIYAIQAQTAAIAMFAGLYANAHDMGSREIEAWGGVIPAPPHPDGPECPEQKKD